MRKHLPVLSFVGSHQSGKTTLLAKILPRLKSRGLKIGVIKHTHHHDFEIDRPGKDSDVLRRAGAQSVLIASRQKIAFVENHGRKRWQNYLSFFRNSDAILVEGDKHSELPKIEVFRHASGVRPLFRRLKRVIAICSDAPLKTNLTQFRLDEISKITDFVVKRIARK